MTAAQSDSFTEVLPNVDSDQLEQSILARWERDRIFEQSLEQTKDQPPFVFYDGPPYATGKPHYGHILQSSIKDTVLRYKTMQGYYVPRRVGWDTHGLPIENLVEKELGYTTKQEIEDDIAAFNQKCRETVFRYVDEFTATLKRIGRWADYDQAYSTMDRSYMESEWWAFKQVWDQELIYKDFRSTPYCIRCATPLSNFEVSMAYKDTHDLAVYVKLKVTAGLSRKAANAAAGLHKQLWLLVWTTTPWTLPANIAVAYNPDIEYVVAELSGEQYIIAREKVAEVLGEDAVIIAPVTAQELEQYRYEPLFAVPFEQGADTSDPFRVVAAEHVTAQDGTGLVHMAPAFGAEDFAVGKNERLPVLRTVDTTGNFTADVPYFAGQNIFEANKSIAAHLKGEGVLFKQEHYKHSYPFCWRCDTPLIYYALDTWFLRVAALKEQMLAANEQIHWIPEHVKQGRFGKGIAAAPDWAISRNRFWSVPIPVWECDNPDCNERICVGSLEQLQSLSGASDEHVADIHRPFVDDITWACQQGNGTMHRIPEVLDVWFDSGSMPYSQWHYPFENKAFVEGSFPADFIVESIEMTRAWFYVLHVLAAALTKQDIGLGTRQPAFKNVIGSGIIFAEDGKKLSKKLKNYPEVEPTIAEYGADALRFYLLTSSTLGEPYRFSEKDLRALRRNVYLTLWNVYSFFVSYARVHGVTRTHASHPVSEHILDRWIQARLLKLEHDVTALADSYHIDAAGRLFIPFIDELSNWYVRRSRTRFQRPAGEQEKAQVFGTLQDVLVRLSALLAPFMPYITEEMYGNLTGQASVHLVKLLAADELPPITSDQQATLAVMERVRSIVSSGLALRAQAKIKVRQPLAQLAVTGEPLSDELAAIIKDEVNVKQLTFADRIPAGLAVLEGEAATVGLDTALTDELKAEGMAREIIRHGQTLRRKAGYALDDHIVLIATTDDDVLQAVLKQHEDVIRTALQADEILASGAEDASDTLDIQGRALHVGVHKP